MIVDTYGGECPVCQFDRIFMRYGSHGWFQFDACPRCGFAYAVSGDHIEITNLIEFWKEMVMRHERILADEGLPVSIDGMFEWAKRLPPSNEERKTVFVYSEDDIAEYKESKLYKERSGHLHEKVIFN